MGPKTRKFVESLQGMLVTEEVRSFLIVVLFGSRPSSSPRGYNDNGSTLPYLLLFLLSPEQEKRVHLCIYSVHASGEAALSAFKNTLEIHVELSL